MFSRNDGLESAALLYFSNGDYIWSCDHPIIDLTLPMDFLILNNPTPEIETE